MPRVILVVVAALLTALGSGAYAQSAQRQVAPLVDPNIDSASSEECAAWRKSLSAGRKLSPDDQARFYLCIASPAEKGIAPSLETHVPFDEKRS
jgi:hypothetical protein